MNAPAPLLPSAARGNGLSAYAMFFRDYLGPRGTPEDVRLPEITESSPHAREVLPDGQAVLR